MDPERADPWLVWLAAVLMAAVTINYVAQRSMNPASFNPLPAALAAPSVDHIIPHS
jgi:hypothetical protein